VCSVKAQLDKRVVFAGFLYSNELAVLIV
jgi:hypothetical protein